MNKKFFYITTTAPYVNADPHIGFALEIVQADAIARYHKLLGENVAFSFGTDEHGLKIYRKAVENNLTPQEYCDRSLKTWVKLKSALNLSYTHFIRTTDNRHVLAAQEIWRRCLKNGDIYKKNYQSKYCIGCELEKTDSELIEGKCPLHPNLKIELIAEENYFFRFSKYQQPLLEFYDKNPNFVMPNYRFNEIKEFVKKGLQDFSISRVKSKMPWGVPIPDDPKQVMYVWFDALTFYISTLDWPNHEDNFTNYWGTIASPNAIQIAGKDNLRQQTAIWQAMLLSAGLPNSKHVLIHGFITSNGQKMSKSLGNVVDPLYMVDKYGIDIVRYYLLMEIPTFDDGDFSEKRLQEIYNSDLANGLGNLVARVTKLCEKIDITTTITPTFSHEYKKLFETYDLHEVISSIWKKIKVLDLQINNQAPWKIADPKILKDILQPIVNEIANITFELQPFLPNASEKILTCVTQAKIASIPPLFPRLK